MALFNKVLNFNRKRNVKTNTTDFLTSSRWIPPEFDKCRIRVLVFRECEWRGRKLLFDLNSVKKIEPECLKSDFHLKCPSACGIGTSTGGDKLDSGHIEISSSGIGYQYLRPRPDVKMLGEMIFGSVAMSFKGVALKIHSIRSSSQLMFSKVFSAPVTSCRNKNDRDSIGSNGFQSSLNESIPNSSSEYSFNSSARSIPVDVPINKMSLQTDQDLEWMITSSLKSNGASELEWNGIQKSPESSSSSSLTRSGSYNSLHRRWQRTQNTSIEFGIKRKSEENVYLSGNSRTKLGVSVVISLGNNENDGRRLQTFFFSHIALIENYVNKLTKSVEQAYANRKQFVHSVMEASEGLQQSLCDLYTAPRFSEPVWLSMMTNGSFHQPICQRFICELTSLLSQNDSKNTNFFMSTLLTAVLTHHLAWVPTVTPPDILPNRSFYAKHRAKWLDVLAKSHPYNPLWVQLGDLYGALGNPPQIARTVIVGSNAVLVKRILYCLTYFIRCCEVCENVEQRSVSATSSYLSNSSTSSGSTLVNCGISHNSTPLQSPDCNEENPLLTNGILKNSSSSNTHTFELKKTEVEKLVEIQDGEGEDDDDEVFLPKVTVTLRPKITCNVCTGICKCKGSSNRNGVISDIDIKNTLSRVGTGNGLLCNIDDSINKFHDSGVDFNVDVDDKAKVRVLFPKDNCHNKAKRKGSNGRVVFTIGNIPLEEIYNPLQIEDDSNEGLVCTCGRHKMGGDNKENVYENVRPIFKLSNSGFPCTNSKALQTNLEQDNSIKSIAFDIIDDDRFSSTRCDSGIHSCELSLNNLIGRTSSNIISNSVEALQINIPPVKVEHIKNVGKSIENKLTEKQIIISKSNNSIGKIKVFNYERTNSMFDEYFDENVELQTLDDEIFEEKLKINKERLNKFNGISKFYPDSSNRDSLQHGQTNQGSIPDSSSIRNSGHVIWNSKVPTFSESDDFFEQVVEYPMPQSDSCNQYTTNNINDYYQGFGWSLTANYLDHYMADFALQGTSQTEFGHQLISDLKMAVSSSVLDETISEAIAIVANTDDWTVQLITSKHGTVTGKGKPLGSSVMMSQLVAGITDSILQLRNLNMSPEFCLMHLEDRLQELYLKSRLLNEYTETMRNPDVKLIVQALGIEPSDLPLLLSIASIKNPAIGCT